MTDNKINPHAILTEAADIIKQRGQMYGGIENNFKVIADLDRDWETSV